VDRGITVMLASVRKYSSAREIADWVGVSMPLICEGGATIYNQHGEALHAVAISKELLTTIVTYADTHHIPLLFTSHGVNYATRGAIQELTNAFDPDMRHIDRPSDIDANLPITRLIVAGATHVQALATLVHTLPLHFAAHYRRDGTLEDAVITAPTATKGLALHWWCQHHHIDLRDVLAIGDAEADLSMLACAGYRAAPANATAQVRAAVDWVGPLAEEAAVATAIEYFVP
jgi:hydroxymethylpyrimidine pyrophosphatase-like HAD family hydrolase